MLNKLFDLIKFAIIKIKYSIGWLSINEFNDCVIDFIKSQGIVFIKFSQIVSSRSDTKNNNIKWLKFHIIIYYI